MNAGQLDRVFPSSPAMPPASTPLEQLLEQLTRYGAPRVSQHSSGWHCALDMRIADGVKGAEFRVASNFDHESPRLAVLECFSRVLVTMKKAREL